MSNEYVIIPKSEREIAKWAIEFTEVDLEYLMERRGVLQKFFNKSIHKYQTDHWHFQDVGKEWETYIAVNTIHWLMASLDATYESYKQMKQKEREEKAKIKIEEVE